MIYGVLDSYFKAGEKSTGGQITMVGNTKDDRVSPIL